MPIYVSYLHGDNYHIVLGEGVRITLCGRGMHRTSSYTGWVNVPDQTKPVCAICKKAAQSRGIDLMSDDQRIARHEERKKQGVVTEEDKDIFIDCVKELIEHNHYDHLSLEIRDLLSRYIDKPKAITVLIEANLYVKKEILSRGENRLKTEAADFIHDALLNSSGEVCWTPDGYLDEDLSIEVTEIIEEE